jgi:hypothetical protein
MYKFQRLLYFTYCLLFMGLLSSCYKKDVQVGADLAESHTRIITVDTVGVILSTYVLDSFATSGDNFSLIGNYSDTYAGNTVASTYFQPGLPTLSEDPSTLLPKNAVYDSLMLYMKPNGYYYGDTTKPFSIVVNQLAAQPDYTNTNTNKIYNTSYFPVNATPLATYSQLISPNRHDSVKIRLPDNMGADYFSKIQQKATQFTSEANFLNYFNGISIQPTSATGAVYGFNLADSSIRMRLHYHTTIPYLANKVIDFIITRNSYQFNRILTDRSKTTLAPTVPGQHEFFPTNTNPFAITQSGTGVLLKAKFPSLRNVLKIDDVVKLMSAKLIIEPVRGTYDLYVNKLPDPLYMITTDNTNNFGSALTDTTGSGVQYRSPDIDYVYGITSNYTFTITSYASYLLNTSGTAENGMFILQSDPSTGKQINRGVIGSRQNSNWQAKLVLTLLTID